jgi:uncharacterized tellurite resistance protein B-like protein
MSSPDHARTLAICDLLLGAAHADDYFHDQEREAVRDLLLDLHGGDELPDEVEARIEGFDAAGFEVARAAEPFRADPADERKQLLHLVAAIHDADEELDLSEDDYLRALAAALELPAEELRGLVLEFEVEELRDSFTRLQGGPPPIPAAARAAKPKPADAEGSAASDDVDVKIED